MSPALRCPSAVPSTCLKQLCRAGQPTRSFSMTSRQDQRITRARRQMLRWLAVQGQSFLNPASGSTNYMGAYNAQGQLKRVVEAAEERAMQKKKEASKNPSKGTPEESEEDKESGNIPPETTRDMRPFPLNPAFLSQPVLSDEFRELIWEKIMKGGKSVREVSAELSVEMSRVGAVVRLKEIEKEWIRIGRPLAKPYHEAVMSMVPQSKIDPQKGRLPSDKPHESINDLPVHRATGTQIFLPTSESRHFTREDAAKAFHERLLPADKRVPHPELAEMHKDVVAGLKESERIERKQEMDADAAARKIVWEEKQRKREAAVKKINTGRYEFQFTEVSVDDAGKDGRGLKGVGWRYGHPHMDRSRGQVKIPTSVE